MVVTDSALATSVGVDVLDAGGNAADAAVAVAFTLAVVYPEAGNVGCGGFAVVRAADGTCAALDFREIAPARAHRDMYLERGGMAKPPGKRKDRHAPPALAQPVPGASRLGHLAAGVPGSVAGLWALHERFGSKPWSELLAPAIVFAARGFRVDFGMGALESVHSPRLHEQWQPDEIALEEGGFTPEQVESLKSRGHALRFVPEIGSAPVILRDPDHKSWTGAADPRRGGLALGH